MAKYHEIYGSPRRLRNTQKPILDIQMPHGELRR
jgi:hypothetical protein